MFAGLSDEITKSLEHVVADAVVVGNPSLGDYALDLGVKILPVSLKAQEKGHSD